MTPLQDCEGVRCHGLFSGSCSFFDEALPGSLTLVLAGVAREAMRSLWTAIEWRVETLAALNVDIEQARQTLTVIEETTWGLELREIDGARFVVLPAGSLRNPPWTVGGQLSSE